jgi:hypothetical protein
MLRITIPERWLSGAEYPVVVDPVIGTSTVGSQKEFVFKDENGIQQYYLIGALAVNKYMLTENFNGTANAYVCCVNSMSAGQCKPILYSDNNDKPLTKLSTNEENINVDIRGVQYEWRSSTFKSNADIPAGSYIWFGVTAVQFKTWFDYGTKLYWYSYDNFIVNFPNTFPFYPDGRFYDYKLSMYFTYSNAQDYVCTLTQGVTLSDNRKLTAGYRRSISLAAGVFSMLTRYKIFLHKIKDTVNGGGNSNLSFLFVRFVREIVKTNELNKHTSAYTRRLSDKAGIELNVNYKWVLTVKIKDTIQAAGTVFRGLVLTAHIFTKLFARDYLLGRFLKSKQELVIKSRISREIVIESKIK